LIYRRNDVGVCPEQVYLDLLKDVQVNGKCRRDRTKTGTLSVFGRQTTMDISKSIPLVTTKRVPWKACIEELLWFLRGDTDSKILEDKGVNIWKGNTSREFIDSTGLNYREGILGTGYGWNWRFYGAKYSQEFADTSTIDTRLIGGVDQIQNIIHLLKTDPFSRRIVLTAWNPTDIDRCVLPPCHYTCTFYVEEDTNGQKHLSCHYIMRSNDLFLGAPWNIFSYAVLTYLLALKCDMKPKSLVYSCSDVHIYNNHLPQVTEQLLREPRASPKLLIRPAVKKMRFSDIHVDDFDVVGYFPDKAIHADMAI
jgi:thymidylate synthase